MDTIPAFKSNKGNDVSQLLTSDEDAQCLLDKAIFDKRDQEISHFNFDSTHKTFIVFPKDNVEQNTFHAYHLDKDKWLSKIPNSIRKYFDQLYPEIRIS